MFNSSFEQERIAKELICEKFSFSYLLKAVQLLNTQLN